MKENEISLHFPTLERNLIKEMSMLGSFKTLSEGETIIRTGQNIRSAILVLDGLIKVFREDDEGNEFFMCYLDAGKACAISLVCGLGKETSGLTAKAISASTILTIPVE